MPTFVGFLPDGKSALTASYDGTLRLFRVPDGKPIRTIRAFKLGVQVTALSPDGTLALTKGIDTGTFGIIKLWRIGIGQLVRGFNVSREPIKYLAVSPDNRWGLSAYSWAVRGCRVVLWDLQKGEPAWTLSGQKGWAGPVAFSPDGKRALSTFTSKVGRRKETRLVVWQLESGKVQQTLAGKEPVRYPRKPSCTAIGFTAGGFQVVARSMDNSVKFWDVGTGKELRSVSVYPGDRPANPNKPRPDDDQVEANPIEAFALSTEGNRAVAVVAGNRLAGGHFPGIKVWDLAQDQLLHEWPDPIG
jgi:WD40 repeat protein